MATLLIFFQNNLIQRVGVKIFGQSFDVDGTTGRASGCKRTCSHQMFPLGEWSNLV